MTWAHNLMTYMTRHRSNSCNSWINWAKLSAYHRLQSQPAALSGFRGQAMPAPPHLCPCGRASRPQSSIAGWRRRPLHHHNIRYNVTVCCGLGTLITRQENNVDGKAVRHHLRSLNPPSPRSCRLIKWHYSADRKCAQGFLLNKRGAL